MHLCVHRNTSANSWELYRETERQTCGFGSTQQDLGTYRAQIGEVRSEGEVEHEEWSMLDYDADGTRTENGKECPANKSNIGSVGR